MFGRGLRNSCAALLLAAAALPAVAASPVADRIWHGGPILTMNDAAMRVEAVAEKSGRIIAVGRESDVMAYRGASTQVLDLRGRALIPGFYDAHGHIFMGGLQAVSANLLPPPDGNVTDIPSLQRALREWIASNAAAIDKLGVIIGFNYDNAQLKEGRHPTREELDAISKDKVILALHQSGHLGVVNSKGLEVLGYGRDTPNPPGGVIQRSADGKEPNGVLEEMALFPMLPLVLGRLGPDGVKTLVKAGAAQWMQYGYTTVEEARAMPEVAKAMRAVADAGGFDVDVVAYGDVLVDREFVKANVSRRYTNRFRLAGAKLAIDGSPQGFTAWRDRPYFRPVGNYPPGYAGYPATAVEQVIDTINWAFANHVQIITHANGEAAIDLLIAAVDRAEEKHGPGDRRPVLIHGQFTREDQIDELKRLGIVPSFFPMHTYYWGDWHREHTVGPSRADEISPTGWAARRGIAFTTHHDAPVALPDSMRVLDATVTRRSRSGDIIGPDQRLDVITALKAMTIWSAYQHFEEATKGSIEVGKLADFAILSADPTAVDSETLDQLKVVETIKEGQTIYRRAQ